MPDEGNMRSLFGIDPFDDFVSILGDWIWEKCKGVPDLEIEAKIGVLIDRHTGVRLQLPVLTETIIDASNVRFESNMSMEQHHAYNQLLNGAVGFSAGYPSGSKISYKHHREVDYFYDVRLQNSGVTAHIRVTRDSKTHEIVPNCIVSKRRIADLNVYVPNRAFDYRISINSETPFPAPPADMEPVYVREKDRLSYTHQRFNVDLTQVTIPKMSHERVHELEVEIRDSKELMHFAHQARGGGMVQDWSEFDDTLLIFLNNIRLLIR